MSATKELHSGLSERGVEWEEWYGETFLIANGIHWMVSPNDPLFAIEDAVAHGLTLKTVNAYPVTPTQAIEVLLGREVTGETSDGYHTFNELYHHRAILFSVIVHDRPDVSWKSKKHHDGTMYDGMFIVGIETPQGQATYHYDIDPYWDMFHCKELTNAPEWDGHTSAQAIERIATLVQRKHDARSLTKEQAEWALEHKKNLEELVRDSIDMAEFCRRTSWALPSFWTDPIKARARELGIEVDQ